MRRELERRRLLPPGVDVNGAPYRQSYARMVQTHRVARRSALVACCALSQTRAPGASERAHRAATPAAPAAESARTARSVDAAAARSRSRFRRLSHSGARARAQSVQRCSAPTSCRCWRRRRAPSACWRQATSSVRVCVRAARRGATHVARRHDAGARVGLCGRAPSAAARTARRSATHQDALRTRAPGLLLSVHAQRKVESIVFVRGFVCWPTRRRPRSVASSRAPTITTSRRVALLRCVDVCVCVCVSRHIV